MYLDDFILQWWSGFLKQFAKLGYDINNPADRSCLYHGAVVENGIIERAQTDNNAPEYVQYFTEIGNIEASQKVKNNVFDGYENIHKADYAYSLQKPITDEFIRELFNAAENNRLFLFDRLARANSPLNMKDRGEFLRVIGVTEDNNIFVSRLPCDITLKVDKECEQEHITDDQTRGEKLTEAFNKEFSGIKKGDEFNGNKYAEFLKKIGENDIFDGYLNYKEAAFKDAHDKGFDSEYLKNNEGIRTLSSNPNLDADEHLDSLLEQSNGTCKLQELVGKDTIVFDKNMKPVDLKKASRVKRELKDAGLFIYKPGMDMPVRIGFDTETNTLGVTNKTITEPPIPVRKPNIFKRALNSIIRAVSGFQFYDCRIYNKYEDAKKAYKEALKVKEKLASIEAPKSPQKEEKQTEDKKEHEKSPTTELYHTARKEKNRINGELSKIDKKKDREMYKLTGNVSSAWDKIAVAYNVRDFSEVDLSRFQSPENTYFARIVAFSMIEKESASDCTELRNILEEKGYDNFVKAINESDAIKDFKKNVNAKSMDSLCKDHGRSLSAKVALVKAPSVSTPAKSQVAEKSNEKKM